MEHQSSSINPKKMGLFRRLAVEFGDQSNRVSKKELGIHSSPLHIPLII